MPKSLSSLSQNASSAGRGKFDADGEDNSPNGWTLSRTLNSTNFVMPSLPDIYVPTVFCTKGRLSPADDSDDVEYQVQASTTALLCDRRLARQKWKASGIGIEYLRNLVFGTLKQPRPFFKRRSHRTIRHRPIVLRQLHSVNLKMIREVYSVLQIAECERQMPRGNMWKHQRGKNANADFGIQAT